MRVRHLRLDWRAEEGQVVLRLRGEVDADVAQEIKGVEVVAGVDRTLVVDLSGVVFIDIAGLRLLESLGRHGVRFRSPSEPVHRLMTLVGQPDLLPPDAGRDDAAGTSRRR